MNIENVKKAIAIMERAKVRDSVYMCQWQTANEFAGYAIAVNEDDLHACGNRACFAGHIAVSKEFQNDGGECKKGLPYFSDLNGAGAIALWLDIHPTIAESFVYGGVIVQVKTGEEFSYFYDKLWRGVNAQDVIDKLNLLLAGEL